MAFETDRDLVRKIRYLKFKIAITHRFLGRFIYEKMLENTKDALVERKMRRTSLNLCYKHQQEAYRSHYSPKNCDHCKALAKINAYELYQKICNS